MVEFDIIPTPKFEKDVKAYKKKYRNIVADIDEVVTELEKGNLIGDEIDNLSLPDDESSYKVRVANSSAGLGKRGGFRLIYYVVKNDKEIYLLTIYSKSGQSDISANEIRDLIRKYCA